MASRSIPVEIDQGARRHHRGVRHPTGRRRADPGAAVCRSCCKGRALRPRSACRSGKPDLAQDVQARAAPPVLQRLGTGPDLMTVVGSATSTGVGPPAEFERHFASITGPASPRNAASLSRTRPRHVVRDSHRRREMTFDHPSGVVNKLPMRDHVTVGGYGRTRSSACSLRLMFNARCSDWRRSGPAFVACAASPGAP